MIELSKEDALRLLKLLEEQEKELQKEKTKGRVHTRVAVRKGLVTGGAVMTEETHASSRRASASVLFARGAEGAAAADVIDNGGRLACRRSPWAARSRSSSRVAGEVQPVPPAPSSRRSRISPCTRRARRRASASGRAGRSAIAPVHVRARSEEGGNVHDRAHSFPERRQDLHRRPGDHRGRPVTGTQVRIPESDARRVARPEKATSRSSYAAKVDRDTVYVNQQVTWTLGFYTDGTSRSHEDTRVLAAPGGGVLGGGASLAEELVQADPGTAVPRERSQARVLRLRPGRVHDRPGARSIS